MPGGDELADRAEVGKVELTDADVLVACRLRDHGSGFLTCVNVPYAEDDLGSGPGEGASGLDADSRRGAGDQGASAGQVHSGQDLVSGRGESKGCLQSLS